MLMNAYANKMMQTGENKAVRKKRRKRKQKVREKDGKDAKKTD